MNNIKIKKSDLLAKVITNRAKHVAKYKDAFKNYRKKAVAALLKCAATAKRGGKIQTNLGWPVPLNHVEDYDSLIAMLRMSVDTIIDLPVHDFQTYVLDEWEWKGAFKQTASAYNSAKFKNY